jgi:hypothetical protein
MFVFFFSIVDDSIFRDLLSKQIIHLNIDIKNANRESIKIYIKDFCDLFFERKHWNRISRLTETSLT